MTGDKTNVGGAAGVVYGSIYRLVCPEGKSYIGKTTSPVEKRFRVHKSNMKNKQGISVIIQHYGWENMRKEVIDTTECRHELDYKEHQYIVKFNAVSPFGYNAQMAGGRIYENSEELVFELAGLVPTEGFGYVRFDNFGRVCNELESDVEKLIKGELARDAFITRWANKIKESMKEDVEMSDMEELVGAILTRAGYFKHGTFPTAAKIVQR